MRYAHTNIAAKNWKSLSDFYIKVLECSVKPPQRNLTGTWLDNATGLTGAHLEGVHLTLPGYEDNAPTLEIFTYKDMEENNPIMANHTGFTHIAFEVDDVDQTLKLAIENGGRMLGQVTENLVENVGLLKFVYFRDPESNIIEIQSWSS
jgi:catechol 2,3-dioxygenase-like lactoylglutathione lyase family enzyme